MAAQGAAIVPDGGPFIGGVELRPSWLFKWTCRHQHLTIFSEKRAANKDVGADLRKLQRLNMRGYSKQQILVIVSQEGIRNENNRTRSYSHCACTRIDAR
jgi:hypothetical protein